MAKRTLLALVFSILIFGVPLASRAWATHYFGSNLRYGTTGMEVSFLQEYLKEQGYFHYPSITEYFGTVTFGAVKTWQAANGIPNTGFFGSISRAFVNATDTPIASTTPTSSGTVTGTDDPPTSGPASSCWIPNACSNKIMIVVGGGVPTQSSASSTPGPSVAITPATTTLLSGATTTFTATFSNDASDTAMWSASAGTIDPASGAYTAPTVYATTTVTITAQSQTIASVSSTATATVTPLPVGISISPSSTTLFSGATTTFTATVTNGSTTAVTWSALHGTINASGTYTAVTLATSTLYATDTVTAVSVANNTKIATATVTITNGLADEWPLNEGTGTIAYNAVNSANNGTWYGTPSSASGTYYGAGVTSSSIAGMFNGTDDYIDPSLSLTYTMTSTFTWTVWVNLNSGISGTNVILGDRGTTPWAKLTPSAFEYGGGGILSNSIPFNQWEFISVVKSGDSFYYYQNGTLEDAESSTAISSATLPFFIGTDPNDPQDGYTWGSVSDVRIYNTALSQSDIQQIYGAE